MTSHEFLSAGRKHQRVTFANGVVSEFDMSGNRYRIRGAKAFDGQWQSAPELS
jgi:hypothetical protein